MKHPIYKRLLGAIIFAGFIIVGCQPKEKESRSSVSWDSVQDTTQRVATIQGGLQGPESVQYDPDQDVYFISNFSGGGMEADSNGFISRAQPDGKIDSLKFMTGTKQAPFHDGHGMYIIGDTLFVADLNGIHGFNRHSGKHIFYADFGKFDHGFLNDIAIGPDSALYVTDSGKPVLYRMKGHKVTIATDSLAFPCNGIIYDKVNKKLILAAWGKGNNTFLTWSPINKTQGKTGHGLSSLYDGIEMVGKGFIVSSQADSTLQLIKNGEGKAFVNVAGAPADIGLDTKRNQVAVPYVALNRVDIWQLPDEK